MDHPADIVLPRLTSFLCQQFLATEQDMVNSFDGILANSALVIGCQFEDYLEPIRKETFDL